MTKYLGLHETLEVHELLTFKNLCLTKVTMMSSLAEDEDLKNLLSIDIDLGTRHIEQLSHFLTNRREPQ